MADIINDFARFSCHVTGETAHGHRDGTHVKLRENICWVLGTFVYGGYGGIAYHHIHEHYIALFTKLHQCGVWEASIFSTAS